MVFRKEKNKFSHLDCNFNFKLNRIVLVCFYTWNQLKNVQNVSLDLNRFLFVCVSVSNESAREKYLILEVKVHIAHLNRQIEEKCYFRIFV